VHTRPGILRSQCPASQRRNDADARCEIDEAKFEARQGETTQGVAESLDTVYYRTHKRLRKSLRETRQEERGEACVYVCSKIGRVCDEIPY
jgi:hypothetical protein